MSLSVPADDAIGEKELLDAERSIAVEVRAIRIESGAFGGVGKDLGVRRREPPPL